MKIQFCKRILVAIFLTSPLAAFAQTTDSPPVSDQGASNLSVFLNLKEGLNFRPNGSLSFSLGTTDMGLHELQLQTEKKLYLNKNFRNEPNSGSENSTEYWAPLNLNISFKIIGDPNQIQNAKVMDFESPSIALYRYNDYTDGNENLTPKNAKGTYGGASIDVTVGSLRYRYSRVDFTDAKGDVVNQINAAELEVVRLSWSTPGVISFKEEGEGKTQVDWNGDIGFGQFNVGLNKINGVESGRVFSLFSGQTQLRVTFRNKKNQQLVFAYYQAAGRLDTIQDVRPENQQVSVTQEAS